MNDAYVEPGEAKRFRCVECSIVFEVCLEPSLRGATAALKDDKESEEVSCCPFCSGDVEVV